MLERLSPISLRCFDAAKQNARRLRSEELDTRHLMMGLIAHRDAWLTDLLQPYEVTASQISLIGLLIAFSPRRLGSLNSRPALSI